MENQNINSNTTEEMKIEAKKYWWLNDESEQVLNSGYLLKGETVTDAIHRVAQSAAEKLNMPEMFDKFVEVVEKGWMSLSSPIWSNMGTTRGLPISCFNVNIPDSVEGITDKLAEVIIQTKLGGGTSGYFGELRGRGTVIKDNGKSSGAISFMQLFDTSMKVVSQGSCYKVGTKVLTQFGYIDFREIKKDYHKIYIVNDKNQGYFTYDYELTVNNFTGNMISVRGKKTENFHNLVVTDNHRMVVNKMRRLKENNYKGKKYWDENNSIVQAGKLNFHRDNRLPISSLTIESGESLTYKEMLMIAFQADGRKTQKNWQVEFNFTKQRKIERMYEILNKLNITYNSKTSPNGNTGSLVTRISFDNDLDIKFDDLSWINLENKSIEWCKQFIDEISLWDGCISETDHIRYSSTDKINVDLIQAIASISGFKTTYRLHRENEITRKPLHVLSIYENNLYKSGDSLTTESYHVENETVYCCTVPTGKIMVSYENYVTQCGNSRRGNFAAYLDIDHPDIKEFMDIKSVGNPIQSLFFAVCVSDMWMQEMIDGDSKKRDLWAKVLESRQQKGLPYIFFTDTINANKPQIYKDVKANINSSNLCFSGDTMVAIADGTNAKSIKELAEWSKGEKKFPVYCATDKVTKNKIGKPNGGNINNYNWKTEIKNAVAFKSGTKKVIEITLSNGDKFKCTDNHELALKSGGYIEAGKSLGNELESFFTYTEKNLHTPYRHINSITNAAKKQHLMLWNFMGFDNDGIIDHIENNLIYPDVLTNLQTLSKSQHSDKTFEEKSGKNNAVYNLLDKETWRKNVSRASHGSNNSRFNGKSSKELIKIAQDYLKENNLKKMTHTIYESLAYGEFKGIFPKSFSKNRFKGSRKYFFDCVNGIEKYDESLDIIPDFKVSEKHLEIEKIRQERKDYINKYFYEYLENNDINLKGLFVVDIVECGEEDVYDLTVEDNSNFYIITSTEDERYENCQGILVHNCSEIALPSNEFESFVCCLSSMNLELYDEWKDTDAVRTATFFLDAVMSEFIEKSETASKHLKASHDFAKRHRALGLGVMGWHSYLQKNMIPFESLQAKALNKQIFKQISEQAHFASVELGELFGFAPIFDEVETTDIKRRNTTLMAIAPTTSSSAILGQASPGIEPYSSNYFKAGLAKGNFMRPNKYLKQLLVEKNMDTEDVWRTIMKAKGSVQNLEGLTKDEKDVFKTFKEISQYEIILQASLRQKFIDQSQSLNLNIPKEISVKDVNKLLIEAWKLGVKTLYYQRSQSVAKDELTNLVNCTSCEA